jgi:trk system potassium uptake protein TrkH
MSTGNANELSFAVRPAVIARYLGQLTMILAALTFPPIAGAAILADFSLMLRLVIAGAALGVAGFTMFRLGRNKPPHRNEALATTGLLFIIAAASMTWPMMTPGLPLVDAFFESVSAVTTTGLTTTSTVEDKPAAFLALRAWMQWYGGLGIVVLSLAIVGTRGPAARRLSGIEDSPREDLIGGLRAYARSVTAIYLILTGITLGAILLSGAPFFPALIHALSTVSTGGFSGYDNSVAGFDSPLISSVIIFFCVAGAVSFSAYTNAYSRGLKTLLKDPQLHALLLLGLIGSLALTTVLALQTDRGWLQAAGDAFTTGFSAQSTTGFATTSVAEFPAAAKLLLMGAMFVGADVGSSGGGIKMLRFLVVLRFIQSTLRRTAVTPHTVLRPRLEGRTLTHTEVESAFQVIVAFIATVGACWVLFLLHGYDPLDSLFDCVSAVGTVGLSTGITSPDLEPTLKLALCGAMLLGRLEFLALIVLFYHRTWFGKRGDFK